MTGASCAARIEKRLNRLEGVHASVNYATEHATVTFDPTLADTGQMVEAIQSIGYGAELPRPAVADGSAAFDPEAGAASAAERHLRDLRQRLVVAVVLGVP